MTDSKEKKIWNQLIIQQKILDKLDKPNANDSDFVENINLYLKKI